MRTTRVTLTDLARETGVDVSTVSRALNGRYGVRPAVRDAVRSAARRLRYRPNRVARGLVTGQSFSLGLVISDIRNPFFAEVARGAEDAAYAASHDVVLCNSGLQPEKEMDYVWSLIEKRVDGILLHQIRALNDTQQREVEEAGVPIVLLNRPPGKSRFSTVLVDNVRGGMLAGEYLARLGHRKVAHLTSRIPQGNHAVRMKGFRKGLRSIDPTIEPIVLKGLQTFRGGYEMGRKLLEVAPGISAVFAGNDSIAFGVMRALLEAGRRIPGDVSLIGFDNVELAAITHPPLTTIEQPSYDLGKAAVEIVLRLREDKTAPPEHRIFGVRLIERESCRALNL